MKTIPFNKSKYGFPLLMDLGLIEETPEFYFKDEWHRADFFEIMFLESGEGRLLLDQQVIPLGEKRVVFISPFQQRRWQVNRDTITGYFLIFEKDFLELFFQDKLFAYRLHYFFNYRDPNWVEENEHFFFHHRPAFAIMLEEIRNYRGDSENILRSWLHLILMYLNRAYADTFGLSEAPSGPHVALEFKQLMEQHIRSKRLVDEYAELLGVSRVTLNKVNRQTYGQSTQDLIRQRLLAEIKNELCFTNKSVKEIAFDLHFSEPNNLTRYFRTLTGQKPSDFRKAYPMDR